MDCGLMAHYCIYWGTTERGPDQLVSGLWLSVFVGLVGYLMGLPGAVLSAHPLASWMFLWSWVAQAARAHKVPLSQQTWLVQGHSGPIEPPWGRNSGSCQDHSCSLCLCQREVWDRPTVGLGELPARGREHWYCLPQDSNWPWPLLSAAHNTTAATRRAAPQLSPACCSMKIMAMKEAWSCSVCQYMRTDVACV